MTVKNPGLKKARKNPPKALKNPPSPSQLQRAAVEVGRLDTPGCALDRLDTVVGEAQNAPPEGCADGSIDPQTWAALARVVVAGHAYVRALAEAAQAIQLCLV